MPRSQKKVRYDSLQRIGVGLSRLGTSGAVAIGAYAFALKKEFWPCLDLVDSSECMTMGIFSSGWFQSPQGIDSRECFGAAPVIAASYQKIRARRHWP